MKLLTLCLIISCFLGSQAVPPCRVLLKISKLSPNFNETIAHAIHSMTVQGLKMFHPKATEKNRVPTVNQDLKNLVKVLSYAPNDQYGADFNMVAMNLVDQVLSKVGKSDDGLGPNWTPIERVAHKLHMWDLWTKIQSKYNSVEEPSNMLCECLMDTQNNGIYKAVLWVAQHYEKGTPITLLNRPIPKLTDATSWKVWKDRLLHYYTDQALDDAAKFIKCAVKDFDKN